MAVARSHEQAKRRRRRQGPQLIRVGASLISHAGFKQTTALRVHAKYERFAHFHF
jgi:hypothetical protein